MKQKIQTTVTIMIALSFFALTTLNSCDKIKKYDGTIWTAQLTKYVDEDKIDSKITLSFVDNSVSISSKCEMVLTHTYYDYYTGQEVTVTDTTIWTDRGSGIYTCNKKDIVINVEEESYFNNFELGSPWKGTIDKTTMTLSGVYDDQTVTFTKE
ncbi:MAG: hypothetical protein LBQ64_02555 [Bacteroidales bacterium]|jgi:hypothetical protein|nr:hypothetical protein [Bacteroidales bacterium]